MWILMEIVKLSKKYTVNHTNFVIAKLPKNYQEKVNFVLKNLIWKKSKKIERKHYFF